VELGQRHKNTGMGQEMEARHDARTSGNVLSLPMAWWVLQYHIKGKAKQSSLELQSCRVGLMLGWRSKIPIYINLY